MTDETQRPDQGVLRDVPPSFRLLGSLIVPERLAEECAAEAARTPVEATAPRAPAAELNTLEEYAARQELLARSEECARMQAWAEHIHAAREASHSYAIRGTLSHIAPDPERVAIEDLLRSYPAVRYAFGYPRLGAPILFQMAGILTPLALRRILPDDVVGSLDEKNLPFSLFQAGYPAFDIGGGALDQHDDEENKWGSRVSSFDLFDVLVGLVTGKRLTEWDPRLIPVMIAHDRQDLLGEALGFDPLRGMFEDYPNTSRTFTELLRGWNIMNREGALTKEQVLALGVFASRATRAVVNADFDRHFCDEMKPLLSPLRLLEDAIARLHTMPNDATAHADIARAMDAPPPTLPDILGKYDARTRKVFVTRRMGGGVRDLLRSPVHPALESDPILEAPLGVFGIQGSEEHARESENRWWQLTSQALIRQEAEWRLAAEDIRRRPPELITFPAFVFDRTDDPRHQPEDPSGRAVAREVTLVVGSSDSSRYAAYIRYSYRNGWRNAATDELWPRPDVILQFRDTWQDPNHDGPLHGNAWRTIRAQGGVYFYASTFWRGKKQPALRLDVVGALLRAMHALKLGVRLPDNLATAELLLSAKNISIDTPSGAQFLSPYIPAFRTGAGNISFKNPYQPAFPFPRDVVVGYLAEALGRGQNVEALLKDNRLRSDPREYFLHCYRRLLARVRRG